MSERHHRRRLGQQLGEESDSESLFRSLSSNPEETENNSEKSRSEQTEVKGKENSKKPTASKKATMVKPPNLQGKTLQSRPEKPSQAARSSPRRNSQSSPRRNSQSSRCRSSYGSPQRRIQKSLQRRTQKSPQRHTQKQAQRDAQPKENPPKRVGAAKRKHRAPPVLRDMVRLQQSCDCQIPKVSFARLVREFLQAKQLRITPEALEALRESTETYLTTIFSDSYLITQNRKQVTLQPRDVQLVMYLRGP